MQRLPAQTRWVIVGAGFAGASTAWALGRAGRGPGVILEREPVFGFHASGRNAALLYLVESNPFLLSLALRSLAHIERFERETGRPLVRYDGGLTLGGRDERDAFDAHQRVFAAAGLLTELLAPSDAHGRFPLTRHVGFDTALWCPREGVVDIHALLTLYLQLARDTGFALHTNCSAEGLIVEHGRVVGVHTGRGDIRADVVVDASGAWAGRLGRTRPLPLRPMRRHLFVTGAPSGGHHDSPFVWDEQVSFYFRPEGDGLLFSPCDETPMEACDPPLDEEAIQLLAAKLADKAPAFSDLAVRRSWACLRTFAPDRLPMLGFDPEIAGLFHVSALGGYGMTTSAAVGELAATLLTDRTPDWIDVSLANPARDLRWV